MVIKSFTYPGFESEAGAFEPVGTFEAIVKAPQVQHVEIPITEAPKPMVSADDLEMAKNLAREEGFREAYEKAKKEFDEKLLSAEIKERNKNAELLEKIGLQVDALNAKAQDSKQKISDKISQIALSIAKKVCGDVSDKIMEVEISKILAESIQKLDAEERIKIYASPKNAEYLNNKFTGMAVNVDNTMELGDFRIEWRNGFAKRDVKQIWKNVSEICGRHSSLEENETEEQQ